MTDPIRVLFVCLGNICRSPLAEAVFRHQVRERGLDGRFDIDSAGTSGYHRGSPPDARSTETGRRPGNEHAGRSRSLKADDQNRIDTLVRRHLRAAYAVALAPVVAAPPADAPPTARIVTPPAPARPSSRCRWGRTWCWRP